MSWNNNTLSYSATIGAALLALVGCGDDDPMTSMDAGTDANVGTDAMVGTDAPVADTPVGSEATMVRVASEGVEALGEGFVYEGWVIIDGAPVSSGRFNLNAEGALVDADGAVISDNTFDLGMDVSSATAFVLTIEPAVDPDAGPSEAKYLAGPIADSTATATLAGMPAFNTDFSDATGTYILATPTDGDGNENSGVWFVDVENAPNPSLMLPDLPAGWVYEGWVVFSGDDGAIPVSTGRFTELDMADDFSGFSGDQDSPPVPGEDLLVNAPDGLTFPTDLRGRTVVISVEPMADDSPAPFAIKPLVAMVPEDAVDHVNLPIGFNAQTISMTATLLP